MSTLSKVDVPATDVVNDGAVITPSAVIVVSQFKTPAIKTASKVDVPPIVVVNVPAEMFDVPVPLNMSFNSLISGGLRIVLALILKFD
jgi:hypothetical protein